MEVDPPPTFGRKLLRHEGNLNQLLDLLIRKKERILKITLTGISTDGEQYTFYLDGGAQIAWHHKSANKTLRFSGRNQATLEQKLGKYFDPDYPSLKKFLTLYWEPLLGIGIGILGLGVGAGSIVVSFLLASR